MFGKLWRWLCLSGLILFTSLLTSCGFLAQTPPDAAIKLAIVQQLTQTQQALSQSLGVNSAADALTPNFKIESIDVQARIPLADTDVSNSLKVSGRNVDEVYRVKGTFKAKLKASGYDTAQPSSPFEVYLGTDTTEASEVETWYLIPSDSLGDF